MICRKKAKLTAEQVNAVSRAVADPRRFAMLRQIAAADALPCAALTAHADLCPATISHHLKELTEAQLIAAEREGRGMRLSIRRDVWDAYVAQLQQL